MKRIVFVMFLLFSITVIFAQPVRIGYYQFEPYIIFQAKDKVPGGPVGEYWQTYLLPKMQVTVEWVGPLAFIKIF